MSAEAAHAGAPLDEGLWKVISKADLQRDRAAEAPLVRVLQPGHVFRGRSAPGSDWIEVLARPGAEGGLVNPRAYDRVSTVVHEVAKFLVLPGFHQPSTATSYVANTRAYDALDDQQKAALAVAAREGSIVSPGEATAVLVDDLPRALSLAREMSRSASRAIARAAPARARRNWSRRSGLAITGVLPNGRCKCNADAASVC